MSQVRGVTPGPSLNGISSRQQSVGQPIDMEDLPVGRSRSPSVERRGRIVYARAPTPAPHARPLSARSSARARTPGPSARAPTPGPRDRAQTPGPSTRGRTLGQSDSAAWQRSRSQLASPVWVPKGLSSDERRDYLGKAALVAAIKDIQRTPEHHKWTQFCRIQSKRDHFFRDPCHYDKRFLARFLASIKGNSIANKSSSYWRPVVKQRRAFSEPPADRTQACADGLLEKAADCTQACPDDPLERNDYRKDDTKHTNIQQPNVGVAAVANGTLGRSLNVPQIPLYKLPNIDVTVCAWLQYVDGSRGLLDSAFRERIEARFSGVYEILKHYGYFDPSGKGTFMIEEFFEDFAVDKIGHRRLFEKWFREAAEDGPEAALKMIKQQSPNMG